MCVPFISMFHLFFLLLCIIIILFYNVFLVVIMLYGAKKVNHVAMLSSWPLFISTTKRKKRGVLLYQRKKKKGCCHILFIGKLYTKQIITYYRINNVLKIQYWYLKTMRQYICIKWNKMIFHKSYITNITKEWYIYLMNFHIILWCSAVAACCM